MFHRNLTGLDLHEPTNILVENVTGTTLPLLKIVKYGPFGTQRPTVSVAGPSDKAVGVVSRNIPDNTLGYITSFGFLYNINSSPFNEGDQLYNDGSGNLTTIVSGPIVAVVIKKDAVFGILFVLGVASYIDPETGAWSINGNSGTDPLVNFLGTKDNQDLILRTNNIIRARLDKDGNFGLGNLDTVDSHFHQKTHVGYSGSGFRQETFVLKTEADTFLNAYNLVLPDPCIARVSIVVIGRTIDGAQRCMFKRTGLFYRQASNVQVEQQWVSDQTIKSDNGFNISYSLGLSSLSLRLKSAVTDPTYWTGHITIELLNSDS